MFTNKTFRHPISNKAIKVSEKLYVIDGYIALRKENNGDFFLRVADSLRKDISERLKTDVKTKYHIRDFDELIKGKDPENWIVASNSSDLFKICKTVTKKALRVNDGLRLVPNNFPKKFKRLAIDLKCIRFKHKLKCLFIYDNSTDVLKNTVSIDSAELQFYENKSSNSKKVSNGNTTTLNEPSDSKIDDAKKFYQKISATLLKPYYSTVHAKLGRKSFRSPHKKTNLTPKKVSKSKTIAKSKSLSKPIEISFIQRHPKSLAKFLHLCMGRTNAQTSFWGCSNWHPTV